MTTPSQPRAEAGVCPVCDGDKRGLYAHGCWYKCTACNGTGQQPSALDKYNADLGRALRAAGIGQQPAQPDGGEVKRFDIYLCDGDSGRCCAAMQAHPRGDYVLAADFDRLQSDLTAAQQRIADLESELENERARGIHTCHDQCQRPLCVAQRRIISLESALSEAVEIMVHGEKLLPKGEARFRAILENKDPT